MSKNKNPPLKTCSKPCCESDTKSWMFIMKEFDVDNDDSKKPTLVKLRHPRTETASLFLFSPDNKVIHEIMSFSDDKPRSFFVNNEVESSGKIFISTPIDPLFLVLPYLKKYGKCSPLDHIITDEDFPETERLLDCSGLQYIQQIADKRGDESLNAFFYNEEKALKWLEKKVRRVASALKDQGIHVSSNNAISANFVVVKEAEEDPDSYLRYALSMVSNYLPESVTSELEAHLNLTPLEEKKRKSNSIVNGGNLSIKKPKIEEEYQNGHSPVAAKEKKATPSAKAKAMAKAASGTKSITNFFKKK